MIKTTENRKTEVNQLQAPRDNDAVLALILKRIRLLAKIRIAWLRKIWSQLLEGGNPGEKEDHAGIDGYLDDFDNAIAEAAWIREQESLAPVFSGLAEIEGILSVDRVSRMSRLALIFQLEKNEIDFLQAILVMTLDPNIGRVYAYLHDHSARGYVTGGLVRRLFRHASSLPLETGSALRVWECIREIETGRGEQPRLECDPFIRDWLLGISGIDGVLGGMAQLQEQEPPLTHWPVQEAVSVVRRILEMEEQPMIRMLVTGPEGSGRKNFAAAVSAVLGVKLLTIDSDRIPEGGWSQVYLHAQRQAFLDRYAIVWKGNAVLEKVWPGQRAFTLQFVAGEEGATLPPCEGMVDYHISIPVIPAVESMALWRRYIPAAHQWPDAPLQEMVRRQRATIGQIRLAARKGVGTMEEAAASLRETSRMRLGKLAQPMGGTFTWEDLVIPETLRAGLQDLAFEASERNAVWEMAGTKRLFPQGRGLVSLFSGSPGTGKTMAAQVIANHLQLDLFRVDLSALISKYIGETSKNIDRILSRAKDMDIVLLFDEADALFGKRTEIKDAHDRFANMDTNYLLQAIEEYPGIVILASNKKANIDAGFLRRLRFVLDFPKPDAPERHQLWKRLVAELAGPDVSEGLGKELLRLAEMLEITGAQVKMSVLSAVFLARREKSEMTIRHLLTGVQRELLKEGRGLSRPLMDGFKI